MKFDQLIEYDMRDTLFEQAFTEYGGQISPKTFLKKSKLSISFNQQSEVSCSLFLLYVQVENYKNILQLRC